MNQGRIFRLVRYTQQIARAGARQASTRHPDKSIKIASKWLVDTEAKFEIASLPTPKQHNPPHLKVTVDEDVHSYTSLRDADEETEPKEPDPSEQVLENLVRTIKRKDDE